MFGALRLVSVQQGFDPRDFALVAFGGAGPLHANALGRLTGAWPVIVPPSPGVLCALGDATTSLRDESARTCCGASPTSPATTARHPRRARRDGTRHGWTAEGVARGRADGRPTRSTSATTARDSRSRSTSTSTPSTAAAAALARARRAFDAEHERLFSFLLDAEHELVNAARHRRPARGPTVGADRAGARATPTRRPPACSSHRIYVDGGLVDAAVYDRARLRAGDVVTGPAIVTEMDSTTLVLPGHAATVHPSGSLLIRPVDRPRRR